jgi:diguanylate cyclase (GGDEF)-like protein
MTLPAALVIDERGPDVTRISHALRAAGLGLMWTETLDDGLELTKEVDPVLAIVREGIDGLDDPSRLPSFIRSNGLSTKIVVVTDRPDFEKASDWIVDGVFAVLSSPISVARASRLTVRILEGRRDSETVGASQSGVSEELIVYRALAGRLETSELLTALRRTAKKLTGAKKVEAWGGLLPHDPAVVSPRGGDDLIELSYELSRKGRTLGGLKLSFPGPTPPAGLKGETLDALVGLGSTFLAQSMKYEETVLMAAKDPLTGLSNRRGFLDALDREFRRAKRHDSGLSLLALDLDRFKAINDTYGHQMGDEILKWLAQVIGSVVRAGDMPARVGGEEFSIILPHTDEGQAKALAERLRDALAVSSMPGLPDQLRPTVSQGVADLEHFLIESPQDLIYWSDQAMYLAKREGRDAIRTLSDLPVKPDIQDVQHVFQ